MNERTQTCTRIIEGGIVPVVRAATTDAALRAARALCAGGIHVIEITMTVPNALGAMRKLSTQIGDDIILGAGTVLDAETARACIQAGARFIATPALNLDTITAAHALGVPIMAGALTPSEVISAWQAGADMVKVFPCSAVGGARYLRALRAPFPEVRLFPTGGVNLETVQDYVSAGAAALGVGSELVDASALAEGRDSVLVERARQFVTRLRDARRALTT